MKGEKPGDHFSVVKGVGDVNGDGFPDFMVGSPTSNYAKLFFGGSPFDISRYIKFNAPENSGSKGLFGSEMAGGDINHDGYNDIIIGNPNYGLFSSGRAYVYYGGENIDTIPSLTLEEFGYYFYFGGTIETGDINGDGIDDLLIAAPNDDMYGQGRVYIYYGKKEFNGVWDIYFTGDKMSFMGSSISIIGDINKDGYNELVFGAQGGEEIIGRAYLIYGQENLSVDSSVVIFGDTTKYSDFGRFTSALGDINNDGYPDFAIMSQQTLNIYSGRTLELFKQCNLEIIHGSFQSIAGGKDLNKDGYSDILLGKENRDISYAGTLTIYYGGDEFDTIPDIFINGERELQYFANSIDFIGDVNGDGYEDIIAGEYNSDDEILYNKVYLYSMNKTINIFPEQNNIIKNYRLFQNYPNPFNPTTTISFELPKESYVSLNVYNLLGERIETMINGYEKAGIHKLNFNAHNLSSGIYFYILKTNDITITRKMILMK
jgi:hypothetical protein